MTDGSFDEIVSGFYKAARGTIGWLDALLPFQRDMDAFTVYMHAVDVAQGRVVFSYNASDMPAEAEVDYLRSYHHIDPRASLVMGMRPGEWMNCWEHFADDFVATNPFYQDFLIPYGGRYASGVKLLDEDGLLVMLGVHRGRDRSRLGPDELKFCKRLGRHLSDALLTQKATALLQQQSRLGAELLARLKAPVALVDEERHLLQLNPAAQGLLHRSTAVVESSKRLFCSRPPDDRLLAAALRDLLRADSREGGRARPDKVFLQAVSAGGSETLGLYLYALRPTETLRVFGDQPVAMLMFHEAGTHLELDPFVVATAFNLTPGEARVAVAAARGSSPHEIANQHSVSINTVRAQLSSIFAKTGTSRQAELVSLLSNLPMAGLGLRS